MSFLVSGTQPHQSDTPLPTPHWGAWSALLIVGCFYLFQTVGVAVVQFIVTLQIGLESGLAGVAENGGAQTLQNWVLPLSLFLGTVSAIMVSLEVATSRAHPSLEGPWFRLFIGNSTNPARFLGYALLGGVLGMGFYFVTEYVVPPPDDMPQPIIEALLTSPPLLQLGWVFLIVLLFPVVEEVLFRGFMYTGLTQSWGPTVSFLLTTVAFVAVHMPKVLDYWPAAVAVTMLGALTLWIRIRTQSLIAGGVLHVAYNGSLIAAALLTVPFPSNI